MAAISNDLLLLTYPNNSFVGKPVSGPPFETLKPINVTLKLLSKHSRKAVASIFVHLASGWYDGDHRCIEFGRCSHGYSQESSEDDLKTIKIIVKYLILLLERPSISKWDATYEFHFGYCVLLSVDYWMINSDVLHWFYSTFWWALCVGWRRCGTLEASFSAFAEWRSYKRWSRDWIRKWKENVFLPFFHLQKF